MKSADRTRSKRWRSGTRRNKQHPISHLPVCDQPDVCLVHTVKRHLPTVPPMRMLLTRCERLWVDDVRAGRRHVHIQRRVNGVPINEGSTRRFNAIMGLANRLRMRDVYKGSDPGMIRAELGSYHTPPGGVVAAMDLPAARVPRVAVMGTGRMWGKAAAMDDEVTRQRAMGYDVVQYGPMQTGRSR